MEGRSLGHVEGAVYVPSGRQSDEWARKEPTIEELDADIMRLVKQLSRYQSRSGADWRRRLHEQIEWFREQRQVLGRKANGE